MPWWMDLPSPRMPTTVKSLVPHYAVEHALKVAEAELLRTGQLLHVNIM